MRWSPRKEGVAFDGRCASGGSGPGGAPANGSTLPRCTAAPATTNLTTILGAIECFVGPDVDMETNSQRAFLP